MNGTIQKATVYTLNNIVAHQNDAITSGTLTKNDNGSSMLFSFDKDKGFDEHTVPFDATAIILEGFCQIKIGGKEYNLKQGEVIVMPANIPHAVLAIEAFKMLLIRIK